MTEIWTMGEILVEIMRPRPGMPLASAGEFLGPFPSGAPAIFIDTVARLGHTAGIIGGVGKDEFGACVRERLRRDGVDVTLVEEIPGASTAVAFVAYATDGSRRFIYHIDGTPAVKAAFSRQQALPAPRFFHVMGCSLMANEDFRRSIIDAVTYFHAHGSKISFDPNIRPELLAGRSIRDVAGPVLERCAVLLPGLAELELLTGTSNVETAAKELFGSGTLELLVIKRGKSGATVRTATAVTEIPAFAVEEVDPTGAGDCFDAGFLCGLLEERSLAEAGRMAAAAGALNAAAFGPMEGAISAKAVRSLVDRP